MGLNLIWFKSYDPKRKNFRFRFFFRLCKKQLFCVIFFFVVFSFLAFLSFLKDILGVGEKITRQGRKLAIYQSRKFW